MKVLYIRLEGFSEVHPRKLQEIQSAIGDRAYRVPEFKDAGYEEIGFMNDFIYSVPKHIEAKHKYLVVLGGLPDYKKMPKHLKDFGEEVVDKIKEIIQTKNTVVAVITAKGKSLHADFNGEEESVDNPF